VGETVAVAGGAACSRSRTGSSPTKTGPVAIRVFPGNTADPSAFSEIVEVIRTRFGLERLVMVGDRRMITSARIETLRVHERITRAM